MRDCRVCGSKIPEKDCTPILACCRQCDSITLDLAAIKRLPKEGDESSKAVEPQEPLWARTEVGVNKQGWVAMNVPGIEDGAAVSAQQGEGQHGWTCVGFVFAEVPRVVYPLAQGWVNPENPSPDRIELIRTEDYTKRVIATVAIWEKANG